MQDKFMAAACCLHKAMASYLVQLGYAKRVKANNQGGDPKRSYASTLGVLLLYPSNVLGHIVHRNLLIKRQTEALCLQLQFVIGVEVSSRKETCTLNEAHCRPSSYLCPADEHPRVCIEASKCEAHIVIDLDDLAECAAILQLCCGLLLNA